MRTAVLLLWLMACGGDKTSELPADVPGVSVQQTWPLDGAVDVAPWVQMWVSAAPSADKGRVAEAIRVNGLPVTGEWDGNRFLLDPVPLAGVVEWQVGNAWQGAFQTFDARGAIGADSVRDAAATVKSEMLARDSDAYVVPAEADLQDLRAALAAVGRGDLSTPPAGYRYDTILQDDDWFLWVRPIEGEGQAHGIIAGRPAWDLVIEVPHAGFETDVAEEGADALVELGARALLLNGAHRCANVEETSCSGTTSVCGASGPYRVSDVAHHDGSAFQVFHESLAVALGVSLHGFSWSSGEPVAYISDGTDVIDEHSVSVVLRDHLNARLPGLSAAASCNASADQGVARLCGTTNTQGRHTNGSGDVCLAAASGANDRFIHVEQSLDLRSASGTMHRGQLIEALGALRPR